MSDKALRWSLGLFLAARVALTVWSFFVALLLPIQVNNLDLFGSPVLATFNLTTSERHAYSRALDGIVLSFHAGEPGYVVDAQTSSVWSLSNGRAVAGAYAGRALNQSAYTVEDIFPYRGVAAENNLLLALWQRFDTNWYLKIAQRGYAADDSSTVYFPLYPALIRLAGGSLSAALLISNLALVGALYLSYRLTETVMDAATARRAVAYLLLFPTGFFLLAAYSESLFLFFTLGSFLFAIRRRWLLAGPFGALAALTRLQGVLIIVPLAFVLWREMRGAKASDTLRSASHVLPVISLVSIPFATIAFLAFANFSFLASYAGEWHARFALPWENIPVSVALLASGRASPIDALNLLATLVFGVMLVFVWRRLPHEYGLFALLAYFAPLSRLTISQPFVSMSRYVLEIFPVWILFGAWGKNAWVNRAIIYSSVALQLFLSAQFFLWGWIG